MRRSTAPDPADCRYVYPARIRFAELSCVEIARISELAEVAQAAEEIKHPNRSDMFDAGYDPYAIAWVHEHGAEALLISSTDGRPVEVLRILLRQTITNALEDELGRVDLAKRLEQIYAFESKRARLIADNEIRIAQSYGGFVGALRVGMKAKRWLLSNDEGVCPQCAGNAAQGWVPIDLPFASGAMVPSEHGGCRCDAAYSRAPR